MKTEKLYDIDSYLWEFRATVVSCEKDGEHYLVTLDKTAFFPDEGGQGADRGAFIDPQGGAVLANVLDAHLQGGVIYHVTDAPLAVGAEVLGNLDGARRLRHMQNHSGEHIISGIVHNLYGYENVGFHLGERDTTLDFDGELTAEQIEEIERLANEAVIKNLRFNCTYPAPEALSSMSYRSKLELTEDVRIVEIEGLDFCACCAPHVRVSGEIGMIKITEFLRYKGGMRLHILCGFDALYDYRRQSRDLLAISNLLSAKKGEEKDGVERIFAELHASRADAAALRRSLVAAVLGGIGHTNKCICLFFENFSPDDLRQAVNSGVELTESLCVALSGSDGNGYRYCIGSQNVPLRALSKELHTSLGGRGGGTDVMIQGTFLSTRAEIEEFFEAF